MLNPFTETVEDDDFSEDIEKQVEAKFDELFGPFDDDDDDE